MENFLPRKQYREQIANIGLSILSKYRLTDLHTEIHSSERDQSLCCIWNEILVSSLLTKVNYHIGTPWYHFSSCGRLLDLSIPCPQCSFSHFLIFAIILEKDFRVEIFYAHAVLPTKFERSSMGFLRWDESWKN